MEKSLSIGLLLLVFLSGCASTSETLTAEDVLTSEAKTTQRVLCLKAEDLPACPFNLIHVIEYKVRRCVHRWSCANLNSVFSDLGF